MRAAFKGYRPADGETFDAARMRCAIDPDGREPLNSGCVGDSGGPLMAGTTAPSRSASSAGAATAAAPTTSPSVFADVERYRGFILDPNPTWAPTRKLNVKITRSGQSLTCTASGTREAGVKYAYVWKRLPNWGTAHAGRARPPLSRRPKRARLGCFVEASNDGGMILAGVDERSNLTRGVRPRIVRGGCPRSARSDATRCCARSGAAAWPSSTWRASPISQRFVALKELRALHDDDPSHAQRFLREARLAGSLTDPNVVTVYEYLEHDGTPYLAMEYLERGSLRPLVGELNLAQVAGVLEGVLSGLIGGRAPGHRPPRPEARERAGDGATGA